MTERVIFSEETREGQTLRLIASGPFDRKSLDALDGYIKRQRKRLRGLLGRLSADQLKQVLAYDGPEASGDQSLPKISGHASIERTGEHE